MMKLSERRRLREGNPFAKRPGDQETANALDEAQLTLARLAFEKQGIFAFASPIETAANHEAGHAVLDRLLHYEVTQCWVEESLELISVLDSSVWLGFTHSDSGRLHIGPESDALNDIDEAARMVAGPAAEMLFDTKYHLGSSLDEWALFRGITTLAAQKLGQDPEGLASTVYDAVERYLKANSAVHGRLAKALIKDRSVAPDKITGILAEVEPIGRRRMFFKQKEMREAA